MALDRATRRASDGEKSVYEERDLLVL